jgi:hypothetical protein
MWHELFAALLLSACNFAMHALGTYLLFLWVMRWLSGASVISIEKTWWIMLRLVVFLLILHSLEIVVWAQFYVWEGCFPDWETSYYFSLVTYTTLGYGDVLLPRMWRVMAGWEAMIGVLMFGWSTAALVAFIHHVQQSKMKEYRAEEQSSPSKR